MSREVTLYTRNLCGLCDEAAEELRILSRALRFTLIERDIDDDASLREQYNDIVPVVAVAGRIIAHVPLAPEDLRDVIVAALAQG